ncbi:hypothetical protein WA026_014463 [Henosepilachna vigintioctopunctata]|uniref:Uncharacterized protein n=1 Tax=Henosepilachna vigintioctopunctata TaxID=420089 RepID=A0AAW1UJ45_9CUCU
MASSNDHMTMPSSASKPRLSPLDFRNTELVSRLLAATPPYLYNMSLLPNSYFFSEMLRSLVQAKQGSAACSESMLASTMHSRRSRKRPWLLSRNEEFSKPAPKVEKPEVHEWTKIPMERTSPTETCVRSPNTQIPEKVFSKEKQNMFPGMPADSPNSGLVLPPAPPLWFPPIYPSPYVDPLHFFIDLRVSGHIYDKNPKECGNYEKPMNKDCPSTAVSSNSESERSTENEENPFSCLVVNRYGSRKSAFSVPNQKITKSNSPMNLTQNDKETKCTKFDVKSLGFEKNCNKYGTNYILPNISNIYKTLNDRSDRCDDRMAECSMEKRLKLEENDRNISFNFYSDNENVPMMECVSRGNSPVEVVDHDEQEYKIDIQS